jgi:hypothetical protein
MRKKILSKDEQEKLRRYQRGVANAIQRLCAAALVRNKTDFERAQFEIYQMIDDVYELAGFE